MNSAEKKTKAGAVIITMLAAIILLMPVVSMAGNLEPTGPPSSGTMHSLEDIHSKVEVIFNAFTRPPSEICAGTVYQGIRPDGTIGEITGAAACNGDCYQDVDGDLYGDPQGSQTDCIGLPEGYVWDNTDCDDSEASINPGSGEIPNDGIDQDCSGADYMPRFTNNGDGTKTDILTGLIWLPSYCGISGTWDFVTARVAEINSGECGLTDGSVEGDWRLPTLEELQEWGTIPPTSWDPLVEPRPGPWGNARDLGKPPIGLNWTFLWTSTELNDANDNVWLVYDGEFVPSSKVYDYWWDYPEWADYDVYPVRN